MLVIQGSLRMRLCQQDVMNSVAVTCVWATGCLGDEIIKATKEDSSDIVLTEAFPTGQFLNDRLWRISSPFLGTTRTSHQMFVYIANHCLRYWTTLNPWHAVFVQYRNSQVLSYMTVLATWNISAGSRPLLLSPDSFFLEREKSVFKVGFKWGMRSESLFSCFFFKLLINCLIILIALQCSVHFYCIANIKVCTFQKQRGFKIKKKI